MCIFSFDTDQIGGEMETIVCASHNPNKAKEIAKITKDFGFDVITRDEAGVPLMFDVIEDGKTFADNSYKKAFTIMRMTGKPAIADDSGLAVDFLNGAPGVYSARFAGEDCNDERNNDKLLDLMKDVPEEKRTARFISCVTLVYPDGEIYSAQGECPGHILFERRGTGGFGYDPLFLSDELGKTFAEIDMEEKNTVSHRARALAKLGELLRKRADSEEKSDSEEDTGR